MSGTIQIVGRHVSGTRIAQRLWPPHRRGRAGCRSLNTRPPGPHRDNRHGPRVYTRLHTLIRISTMAHDRLGWLPVVTHHIGRNKDRKGATKIVSAWAYICTPSSRRMQIDVCRRRSIRMSIISRRRSRRRSKSPSRRR